MSSLEEKMRKLVVDESRLIDEYGFTSRGVFPPENGSAPRFTYSMGFYRKSSPDVLIWGLDHKTAHAILWNLYRRVDEGRALTDGTYVAGLANFPLAMRELSLGFVSEGYVNGVINHMYRDGESALPES